MKKETKKVQEKTKETILKRIVMPEKRKRRTQPDFPKKYQIIIQTTNFNTVVVKDRNKV